MATLQQLNENPAVQQLKLTSEETNALIQALSRQRGERGYTETEVNVLVDHIQAIKMQCMFVQEVFAGRHVVEVIDNRHIAFVPLEAGEPAGE